jgi:hypothetical protein
VKENAGHPTVMPAPWYRDSQALIIFAYSSMCITVGADITMPSADVQGLCIKRDHYAGTCSVRQPSAASIV